MTPEETVRNAIAGNSLDVALLEKLSFDPYLVDELRPTLLPLLAELLAKRPEVAKEVPEPLVNVLLRRLQLSEILSATKLSTNHLENEVVRPVLLNQLVLKAHQSEDESLTQVMLQRSFSLLADPQLDEVSVALLEKLVEVVPKSALKYIPFAKLGNGDGVQQARLMELNVRLLRCKVVPPLETLDIKLNESDWLLRGLQIEYVQQLIPFVVSELRIQPVVQNLVFWLARQYDPQGFLANATERALAKLCHCIEPLFFGLDTQFLLVRVSRIGLLARLPASYLVKRHGDVVGQLELSASTLPAIANVARSAEGLRRLQLPRARLLGLSVPSQLVLATAAVSSREGASYFATNYADVLRNAVNAPETEDSRDLKTELELNLRVFGLRSSETVSVATSSEI